MHFQVHSHPSGLSGWGFKELKAGEHAIIDRAQPRAFEVMATGSQPSIPPCSENAEKARKDGAGVM